MREAGQIRDRRTTALGDYVALLKPRVMSLVIFTAFVGLVIAPARLSPLEISGAIIFIAVGAGAAGALNMWWDADIDALMRRTARRPIPAARVPRGEALALGLVLSAVGVTGLALAANPAAAALLGFTIFFYVVVYSMWLKRTTPQNIVVGGAAGAFPPVIGWVAATGSLSPEAMLMFALIFLWTPPHFWSLALFMRADYHLAQVPMLTVTHGHAATRRHILAYTLALVPAALWLALSPVGGPVTLSVVVLVNLRMVWRAVILCRRDETEAEADRHAAEKAFFRFSLVYLALHFGALLADAGLRAAGAG